MTIIELIAELEKHRAELGDLEVAVRHPCQCPGDDDMLGIDPPELRYWQHEEYKPGRQQRVFADSGTPILILD